MDRRPAPTRQEGAWFRDAAYPYAATETCVGHSTISTGSLPATHGMVANAWWDRESHKNGHLHQRSQRQELRLRRHSAPKVATAPVRMLMPSFAEELKFQTGGATRVVTFSLESPRRDHDGRPQSDAATWFDSGGWVTSSAYGTHALHRGLRQSPSRKATTAKRGLLRFQTDSYWYDDKAPTGAAARRLGPSFPHPLRGKSAGSEPDDAFYEQWSASPFADNYLTDFAETAVDALSLRFGPRPAISGRSAFLPRLRQPPARSTRRPRLRTLDSPAAKPRHSVGLDKTPGRPRVLTVARSADRWGGQLRGSPAKRRAMAAPLHFPETQDRQKTGLERYDCRLRLRCWLCVMQRMGAAPAFLLAGGNHHAPPA